MADIKLFVCCHQPTKVPKHPLLVPIQVGAALATDHFPGFLYDDTGDNISVKNRSYCELTAQYWVWKNYPVGMVGFFHYRRYLSFIKAKYPYFLAKEPTVEKLEQWGYEEKAIWTLVHTYDVILPRAEETHCSVQAYYAQARWHRKEDLKQIETILKKITPEFYPAAQQYLNGTRQYFGNIFLMKWPIFESYCTWLFSILEEFDKRNDLFSREGQAARVDGYLGERLLGIYCTWLRENPAIHIAEFPRVQFEGSWWKRTKRYWLNIALPPESRRRAMVKKGVLLCQNKGKISR